MTTSEEFKNGMQRLTGGVSIITSIGDDGWRGLTATAVTSLSADPPSLLVCINNRLETVDAIKDTEIFGVNVLSYEQMGLARCFAGMEGVVGPDKFKSGSWCKSDFGVPMLKDSLVGFECKLFEHFVTSTHSVFMGHVVKTCFGDDGQPLLYSRGQFSTLAA